MGVRTGSGAGRALGALALVGALFLGVAGGPASATGKATGNDWLTYGWDLERIGWNPTETILTPSTVPNLKLKWSFDLGAVTIMQPVLASGVVVNGNPIDVVYIGSEHG